MKHIAISLLLAVFCSYGTMNAAPAVRDTLNHYVIDNQPVDQFDGTQLEGKKIVSYRITSYTSPSVGPIKLHKIQTKGTGKPADPVYVIDGKQVSKRKYESLSPAEIKTITVVKNGSQKEARKYPGWENGVIMVETKEDGPVAGPKDTQVQIGYGEADSRDLSYSVSSVKPDETDFYTNMYEYLRAKVTGVQVKPDNTVVIRGVGTINSSTQPLILLDGVEITNLDLVNPHDVYSVDVLKDASTAIYGMKGANGVILITTKVGHKPDQQ